MFTYLAVPIAYFLVVTIAGRLRKNPGYGSVPAKKRIAVLIPSYKEDEVIVSTARKAREHDYPADHFDVFVAAHGLRKDTIEHLRNIPVHVLEVDFKLGSKARSLNGLLNYVPEEDYDVAIVLDADNHMLPGCLEKVNAAFQRGFRAVQCHRIAKNKHTPVAVLDAISEEVNNHIFRQGPRAVGFSSVTIGSGMAFEFSKIKQIYNKPGILGNPACDREVDFEIMKADICIEFIPDAYVLDEKVSSNAVFEKQRTRWQESQIIHLRLFFDKHQQPVPRTMDYWNRLFINLIPPRLMFIFAFLVIFALALLQYLFSFSIIYPPLIYWIILAAAYGLVFLLSIPAKFFSLETLQALAYVPVLMFSMIKGFLKMNADRKEFLHTPKSFTQDVN